jgi:hypothetical protein
MIRWGFRLEILAPLAGCVVLVLRVRNVTLDVENASGRMAVKKENRHEISP